MTAGPEHYKAAEDHLREAERVVHEASISTYDEAVEAAAHLVARAQVYATLAVAAATAHSAAFHHDGKTADAWRDTIAVPRPTIVNHP